MEVSQFDFYLPEALIAQTPAKDRTSSRLLTLNRHSGIVKHHQFADLIDYVNNGDTIVLNDTKVIPARLFGVKQGTGAKAEVLLLTHLGEDRWEALVRPAKKLKLGDIILFGSEGDTEAGAVMSATIVKEGEIGGRVLKFHYDGIFNVLLDQLGEMPLPPYIKEQLKDKERYQTVYAKHEGSAAAPTAGLHFSTSYMEQLRQKGVSIVYVTLHVGLGTFRPVSVDRTEDHEMHAEYYELSAATAAEINATRARGGRIIAVGTTSARTLEAVGQELKEEQFKNNQPFSAVQSNNNKEIVRAMKGWTNIFITPGYKFEVVDALLTNFHLPKSTLMMLISAFADRNQILQAYDEAIKAEYRFFSFGDAMFIY